MLDLVVPGDMYRPWHAQVLAAMRQARARGAFPGRAEPTVSCETIRIFRAPWWRMAVALTSLMEAAPRREHAPAYASMVVEGGIRRHVELAGARLVQAPARGWTRLMTCPRSSTRPTTRSRTC
jgi:hypothetical protein